MPKSPTQTFCSFGAVQPLVWDARTEEHSRSRTELPIRITRSMSPVSPFMSQEALSSPLSDSSSFGRARTVKFASFPLLACSHCTVLTGFSNASLQAPHPDPLMEVASLFLHTSMPASPQDTVHAFPTRTEKATAAKKSRSLSRSRSTSTNSVRGLLSRSFNINQPRWVPV